MQLYIRIRGASVEEPLRVLKGFQRVKPAAGRIEEGQLPPGLSGAILHQRKKSARRRARGLHRFCRRQLECHPECRFQSGALAPCQADTKLPRIVPTCRSDALPSPCCPPSVSTSAGTQSRQTHPHRHVFKSRIPLRVQNMSRAIQHYQRRHASLERDAVLASQVEVRVVLPDV